MNLIKTLIVCFYVVVTTTTGFSAHADDAPKRECEVASEATEVNAQALAAMVRSQIRAVEESYRRRGQELKVVLIARGAKRSLDDIDVLGNNNRVRPDRSRSRFNIQFPNLPADMTANEFEASDLYRQLRRACNRYSSGQGGPPGARSAGSDRSACMKEAMKYAAFPREQGPRGTLDYFHVGIALKNHPITDHKIGGAWGMVHELKPSCRRHDAEEFSRVDQRKPYIYEEDFIQFFLEELDQYKAIVIVPNPALQRAIENLLINNKDFSRNFTGDRYNAAALAYQGGRRNDQNSNQWVAEIMAASQDRNITTRQQAQDLLRRQNFMPSKLDIGSNFIYSLGSFADSLFNNLLNWDIIGSVNLKGHKLKDYGIVEVVTVRSIQNYMADNSFAGRPMLDGEYPIQVPQALVQRTRDYETNEQQRR